jgi:GNAT superfamily N-acetyltransferase
MSKLSKPVALQALHNRKNFDCGDNGLNEWLRHKAEKNHYSGASRCYVTCNEMNDIVGFYCLSAGAVARNDVPKKLQRNMPDPLPVMVMGRLAVDTDYHNQGIGKALLKDAIMRTLHVADQAEVVALLVHSLSERAKQFYISCGFIESSLNPMTLCLPCITAVQALDGMPDDVTSRILS